MPGDNGGGEFPCDADKVRACVALLLDLEQEFDFVFVDHDKTAYVPDLEHIVTERWLHPGRSWSPPT